MQNCPHCQTELPDSDNVEICPSCGKSLQLLGEDEATELAMPLFSGKPPPVPMIPVKSRFSTKRDASTPSVAELLDSDVIETVIGFEPSSPDSDGDWTGEHTHRPTSPEIVIQQARSEATITGLGVVRGVPTTLVGRSTPLAQLTAAYKSVASNGKPRAVLVSGPTGTGKTRLVFEMLETLRLSDYPFALMTCFGTRTGGEQVDVVQRLLASRLRLSPDESVEKRFAVLEERVSELFDAPDRTWALQVLSAFYELPADGAMMREVQALRSDRSALRRALRDLVERLVTYQAASHPVILWFDDLESDDAEGLIEVAEMIVKLKGLPLLSILGGTDSNALPIERLRSTNIAVDEIALGQLEAKEAEELVRDILRLVENLPDELVTMIVQKAQGVPLAIEQLIRLLLDHDVITTGEEWQVHLDRLLAQDELPDTVEDLSRVRIATLTEDQRYVLGVAAMLGSPFPVDDLVSILRLQPMDFDEVPWFVEARESWTKDILLDLMGREIIAVSREDASAQSFEFKFPNEQRVLVEEADPAVARMVHGCYARLLSERDADANRVATHLEAAGLFKEAARRWLEVGHVAERAFYNHSALDAYTHALGFLGPEDGGEYLSALMSVGRIALRLGVYNVGRTAFATAIQISYAFDELATSIQTYRFLGRAQRGQGSFEEACINGQRALTLAEQEEPQNPVTIADCTDDLAWSLCDTGIPGAFADALKLLEASLEIRRTIGIPSGTANTLDLTGMVCIGRGDLNRALACFMESLNARQAVDDWSGLCQTLNYMARVSRKLGRGEVADKHLQQALEAVDRTGNVEMRLGVMETATEFAIANGELDSAHAIMQQALELAKQVQSPVPLARILAMRALFQVTRGNFQEAHKDAVAAARLADRTHSKLLIGLALRVVAQVQGAMVAADVRPRPAMKHTRDRFLEALSLLEDMGNWHEAANTLRAYGRFLAERGKDQEADRCLNRANKLDPLTQTF